MEGKRVVLVTGCDTADRAVNMLRDFDVVYAGHQPTEDQLVTLCERHNPVAIGALRQNNRKDHGCSPCITGYIETRKRH